ncbi:hypothetical protein [Actinacidiphila acididurans]|uniref:Lipoprotein n=1 Tax=Actinacidiphila acididurans TaxID=2784346 RepID=A0ABS2TW93_9ACTN|nr:hypothetical protein [Actinacidiphila acididurans]MBM9506228.1 hypothetical protein [Actinacidiphila acididurans]
MHIPRRHAEVLAATFLTAVLAGCSTPPAFQAVPVTTGSAASSPSAPAPPSSTRGAPASGAGAQLLATILPVPAGAHAWTVRNGVLDLDGFARGLFAADAVSGEKAVLARRRFVVAARQSWFGTDGSQADIFLVRFAAPTGAESMYESMAHTWQTGNTPHQTIFADPADHATGAVNSAVDKLGNAGVKMISVRGDVFVYVHYFTAATPDRSGAQHLFRRQLDALHALEK